MILTTIANVFTNHSNETMKNKQCQQIDTEIETHEQQCPKSSATPVTMQIEK